MAITKKPGSSRFMDYLKALPQFWLPHHLLCNAMYAITRSRNPLIKNTLINWFSRRYRVNMDEALGAGAAEYQHFNAFFTRALRPGMRPVCDEPNVVLCPIDGAVSQVGLIHHGRIFQAKGRGYSLLELIGGDQKLAAEFDGGAFITLYLSPKDYHRIHMPLSGRVKHMLHVPGRLFSVNPSTTRAVQRLFARNERVVTLFENPIAGDFFIILVGALFVGSMETLWHGVVTPPHGGFLQRWDYDPDPALDFDKNQEMGRFNMGSTVILLFKAGKVHWSTELEENMPVKMGRKLGDLIQSSGNA